ncbi:TSCPD domain-containing protein [Desulfuromonas versatilis]|uniref:ribonucleoside-diphosphate reductase n=1 Tax=Desulfuromonas versatilis TaxID=2802975 RepID=A0ABM7N8H7_9BACT|nr:TIGR03905 family TSCPD domain-containing protein [Desulfuromonas versatilis]BCR03271.1 TSCPD domain-containing protein [Desulfuromonas versatilis]
MKTTYTTTGTCARFIDIELEGEIISEIRFIGGCAGNTRGISCLVKGMDIAEVAGKLKGTICRNGTSCPDQLARALEELSMKQAI